MTFGSRRTSSGVPSAIFSPWSRTVTRSLMPMTTRMSCSMSSTVRPRSLRSRPMSAHQLARLAAGSCRRSARRAAAASGSAAERARDLEAALVAVRQVLRAARRPALEADELEQLAAPGRRAPSPRGGPRRRKSASTRLVLSRCASRPARSRARSCSGTAGCSGTSGRARGDHVVGTGPAEDAEPAEEMLVPRRPDDAEEQDAHEEHQRDDAASVTMPVR